MNESLDGERWKSPGKEKKVDMYFYIYACVCIYRYIFYIYLKSLTQP